MFQSSIDGSSDSFGKNQQALLAQINTLQALQQEILLGGGANKQQRHKSRGKLLVRDSIALLLDPDSTLLELSPYCAHGVYQEPIASAGIIIGIGKIHGIDCMIIANDASVKGGSYYPLTVKKHLRGQEIAANNHLPCIYLVDSGGANLPHQAELFADRDHFGRIFYNQARMSAQGIAQIAVVLGACTAGGAYVPAMADEAIIVRDHGSVYLAGPPLVQAATGEVIDRQSLGGANLHCRQSGLIDYACDSPVEAITQARQCLANSNRAWPKDTLQPATPPQYSEDELLGIIPADRRHTYDVREIIARLVDNSEFNEFKPLFGTTLVCAFARIGGTTVGIIANNGILFSDSALKATHFIQLCCQRQIALLFLQNITGFMVGQQAEASGIAKHGAKMVAAVACAAVPKITIIIGGSYGAGNYAMCGRAYNPDFLFSWPNARVSVMGGDQAGGVLAQIKQCSEAETKSLQQQFSHEGEVIYGSARLWDDGIIDPRHSRKIIAQCLAICSQRPEHKSEFGIWRM